MALADEQVSIGENDPTRNLIMGVGTPFEVIEFNPWIRTTRTNQQSRPWNHGRWMGAEWLESATIPLTVGIDAFGEGCNGDYDTWIANRHALQAAWRPIADSADNVELRFRYGSDEYVIYGRPRVVDPRNDWISWVEPGNASANLVFEALDPLIYAAGEGEPQCVVADLAETQGGVRFQEPAVDDHFRFPIRFDAIQIGGGPASMTNEGTAPTGLTVTITGPIEFPAFTVDNADGDIERLQINEVLTAGQTLVIDTVARTVLLNGTVSRRGSASGIFPLLWPGTHEITLSAATFDASASLQACWRSAWF